MGVAMYSILSHNKHVEKISFFVIDNHISKENREKLNTVIEQFDNADIRFINFNLFENKLHLNLTWPISLSSYARLFVGEMLPDDINRVLYLDCDIVVNDSLVELWNTNLKYHCLGAVQDTIPTKTKAAVGLTPHQRYFNAGVLLIDLQRWREMKIGQKCLDFIDSHNGQVVHHDQGVLNGILKEQWVRLPLTNNVMTILYMMSPFKIKKFYKDNSSYYDSEVIEDATKNPVILHFTPSLTSHPWEMNCAHPMRDLYLKNRDCTPWKGFPQAKDPNPLYVRLINLRYRYLPIF